MTFTRLLQRITGIGRPLGDPSPLEELRVLLAEDCVDQQRLYLKFLRDAGADVVLECNGNPTSPTIGKIGIFESFFGAVFVVSRWLTEQRCGGWPPRAV